MSTTGAEARNRANAVSIYRKSRQDPTACSMIACPETLAWTSADRRLATAMDLWVLDGQVPRRDLKLPVR